MSQPIVLSALDLRALAEAAASARGPEGDPYFFVEHNHHGQPVIRMEHGKPGEPPPERTVLELDTFTQQPNRPAVQDIVITVNDARGKRHAVDLCEYDAVFWSEAAVEKFVLSYYASKSMWSAAWLLTELSELWYGFVPRPGTPRDTARATSDDNIPFALAHLPSSDYVGIRDDPGALGHGLHLLFKGPHGVTARSLTEVLQERAAARGTAGPAPRTPAATDGG